MSTPLPDNQTLGFWLNPDNTPSGTLNETSLNKIKIGSNKGLVDRVEKAFDVGINAMERGVSAGLRPVNPDQILNLVNLQVVTGELSIGMGGKSSFTEKRRNDAGELESVKNEDQGNVEGFDFRSYFLDHAIKQKSIVNDFGKLPAAFQRKFRSEKKSTKADNAVIIPKMNEIVERMENLMSLYAACISVALALNATVREHYFDYNTLPFLVIYQTTSLPRFRRQDVNYHLMIGALLTMSNYDRKSRKGFITSVIRSTYETESSDYQKMRPFDEQSSGIFAPPVTGFRADIDYESRIARGGSETTPGESWDAIKGCRANLVAAAFTRIVQQFGGLRNGQQFSNGEKEKYNDRLNLIFYETVLTTLLNVYSFINGHVHNFDFVDNNLTDDERVSRMLVAVCIYKHVRSMNFYLFEKIVHFIALKEGLRK